MIIREENIRFILGLKIKQLRKKKNFSQTMLAASADISVSYLNEIESGKKYPKREKLFLIAQVLSTNYNELVSLDLDDNLKPISEILKSNLLSEIPFEDFGIDVTRLFEIFSRAPIRASAFINTFFEMIRQHDISINDFYLSALRSYLEMNKNYFEDVENKANEIRQNFFSKQTLSSSHIKKILKNEFGYDLLEVEFDGTEPFGSFRTLLANQGNKKLLFLNKNQTEQQLVFSLSRELGCAVLGLSSRSFMYPQRVFTNIFDENLNNYKLRYFAGALLMPINKTAEKIEAFFQSRSWKPAAFHNLIKSFNVTPETFLHRLTTVLPKKLNINALFFLKVARELKRKKYSLIKEFHLGGLYGPHASLLKEHYCRRWISIDIFNQLDKGLKKNESFLINAQLSNYAFTDRSYFCISIASSNTTSITIGLQHDENLIKKVKFIEANKFFKTKEVNVTCEKCLIKSCQERAASCNVEPDKEKKLLESLQAYVVKKTNKPLEITF